MVASQHGPPETDSKTARRYRVAVAQRSPPALRCLNRAPWTRSGFEPYGMPRYAEFGHPRSKPKVQPSTESLRKPSPTRVGAAFRARASRGTSHERVRFLHILAILGHYGLASVNQKAGSSRSG
jgi:hypothetical protein